MNRTKIFITFIFLLAFALQVSAQDKSPKIFWKNLQEKYERFEDVKPTIVNINESPIFMPENFWTAVEYGQIRFLKFDEAQKNWQPNYVGVCGTMPKQAWKSIEQNKYSYKLYSSSERSLEFDNLSWLYLVASDSTDLGFIQLPDYNGTGKYKIQIPFYVSGKPKSHFLVESPEFEVTEKSFKK